MNSYAPSQCITIAHDYFTQRGGAERVAAALIEVLKPNRIVTALIDPSSTFPFSGQPVAETSFLQRLLVFRRDPRRALAMFPLAWHLFAPVSTGVVLCSSSGWSHGIRTRGTARKVVYCHNPARWLYQADDYFKDKGTWITAAMRLVRPLFLKWDQAAANSAQVYIANSSSVAARIREVYGRDPVIIHPPVALDETGPQVPVAGVQAGYFISVGRGRGYKNIDHLLAAFASAPTKRLVVVGDKPIATDVPANVCFVSNVSDSELRWLYSHAKALITVSHEDFGLTPIEANVFGTPALVLRAGGFLDSLAEGVSGLYIDDKSPASIRRSIEDFPDEWNRAAIRHHAAGFSLGVFHDRINRVLQEVLCSRE